MSYNPEFKPGEHAKEIIDALTKVKGSDPTDEETIAIVVAVIHPVLVGIAALDRIACALERLAAR